MNISVLIQLPAYIGVFFIIMSAFMLTVLVRPKRPLMNTNLSKMIREYRSGKEKDTAFQGPIGLIVIMAKIGISLLLGGLVLVGLYRLLDRF